jgi:hypothetical protein
MQSYSKILFTILIPIFNLFVFFSTRTLLRCDTDYCENNNNVVNKPYRQENTELFRYFLYIKIKKLCTKKCLWRVTSNTFFIHATFMSKQLCHLMSLSLSNFRIEQPQLPAAGQTSGVGGPEWAEPAAGRGRVGGAAPIRPSAPGEHHSS